MAINTLLKIQETSGLVQTMDVKLPTLKKVNPPKLKLPKLKKIEA